MELFSALLHPSDSMRILDIGGRADTWATLDAQPRIELLNLDEGDDPSPLPGNVVFTRGDATAVPYDDRCFDIVFSNSVIEHVGDFDAQRRMAGEVRRVAAAYYVQTPARSFPLEPHYITPFVHWLPRALQRRILRNFSVWGLITRPSQEFVDNVVASTRLLTRAELHRLFPDAAIIPERAFGLVKSWIIVRTKE